MTIFDEREMAFENKFIHDQDTLFKVRARRARLLGEWAAGHLGLSGGDAAAYARRLVDDDFSAGGTSGLIDAIERDFTGAKVGMSRHRVEREAERLFYLARDQVMSQ